MKKDVRKSRVIRVNPDGTETVLSDEEAEKILSDSSWEESEDTRTSTNSYPYEGQNIEEWLKEGRANSELTEEDIERLELIVRKELELETLYYETRRKEDRWYDGELILNTRWGLYSNENEKAILDAANTILNKDVPSVEFTLKFYKDQPLDGQCRELRKSFKVFTQYVTFTDAELEELKE